jgi:purine-binding chemotaxis protein CheW
MKSSLRTSEEKKNAIMKRRAAELSRSPLTENSSEASLDLLVFNLGKEVYGIETTYIQEVYPLKDYTALPNTPAFLFGLLNLRRKIVSIIDLKVLFDLASPYAVDRKVIILEGYHKEFAVLCDGIIGIQQIPLNNIQEPLPTLTGIRQELLKGISKEGMAILDGAKLLKSEKIIVDEGIELQ